ncbi:MAG: hypothetical protein AB1782_02935 [Cyanobacteriota bacterium]
MNNQQRPGSDITATNQNENFDTIINQDIKSDTNLSDTDNLKEETSSIKSNIMSSDVEAIDNLSALLIDISASIAKYDISYINDDLEDLDTFSLLDKIKTSDLVKINQALDGWKNNSNIIAPAYKPTFSESSAIFQYIDGNKSVSKNIFNQLVKHKACATNFQNFIIKGEVANYNSEIFIKATEKFLVELKDGVSMLDMVFTKIGLTKSEKRIFHTFVSKTATTLFNLGFADAIDHSTQVARKCVIEAYRNGLSKSEMLQAAIIGWIHDPKFPGNFSWNNLSTHPIMASAIALDVLTQAEMYKEIDKYLQQFKLLDKRKKNVEYFVKGVVEAVAINNDSKFVLDNAIFKRPVWAPGLPESGGVLDQLANMSVKELGSQSIGFDSEDLIKDITEIALNRFYAPSKLQKPASFNNEIIKILKKIQIETGLVGIRIDTLENICIELSKTYQFLNCQPLLETFNKMFKGELIEKQFVSDLSQKLKELQNKDNSSFNIIKVSADKLFSHHDEMKYAPDAALSLAIADRLLLSPHKILEAGVQDTTLGRILSFMTSFKDNIKTLPKSAQHGGKIFQRDLYVSILQTADQISNQNNYEKFQSSLIGLPDRYQPFKTFATKDVEHRIIRNQINYLEYIIKDSASWINEKINKDYSVVNPKVEAEKDDFEVVLKAIKFNYNEMIEISPEMFGYVKLNKLDLIQNLLAKL